jgi:hypothetical protein
VPLLATSSGPPVIVAPFIIVTVPPPAVASVTVTVPLAVNAAASTA